MKFAIYTGFVLGVIGIVLETTGSGNESFLISGSILFGSITIALAIDSKG